MAYAKSFRVIHGNKVSLYLDEGTWSDDDNYKEGGYFASEMSAGAEVALVTGNDLTVQLATTGQTPIGYLDGQPMGKNEQYGRTGNIVLYGDQVKKIELHTASNVIAIGDSVVYSESGGSYSDGVWISGSANDTTALESSSASGSISSGSQIYVLFGAHSF